MCGIWGRASNTGHGEDLAGFEAQLGSMRHRGPDDSGLWLSRDQHVVLGHRRLSIIDLSPAGHQPMLDDSHGLAIVFNGEIYNFRDLRSQLEGLGHTFGSNSDTEVLLASYRQWGRDCVEHLDGMFSFCIHDQKQERLFLARDRAGEKPLYYLQRADVFSFASELKALLQDPNVPRNLDMQAFEYFLAYGHVPAERCILEGVKRLQPGHAMSFSTKSRSLDIWQYWKLPEPPTEPACTDHDALLDEFEGLLERSVQRQLVADVPVGVLLSGGLDSSLVTAMAVRSSRQRIRTYTISFPGQGDFDEGPYAKLVAEHFGTEHHELEMESTSLDLLPELARQFDEPTADHAIVPTYLLSKAIRKEVTVALGGDGGDELFGGYGHYNFVARQNRFRGLIPGPIRSLASRAGSLLPIGLTGRNHLIGFAGDTSNGVAHINLLQDVYSRKRLLRPDLWELARRSPLPESRRAEYCSPTHGPLRQYMEADFRSTMVDGYLVKVDRASMLASLEIRAPFLNHELIEFAYGRVPDNLKALGREKKILTKRLAKKLLPAELDIERKRGFTMPVHHWFEGEWGGFFREVLLGSNQDIFQRKAVESLLEGQAKGRKNAVRLFGLAMFSLWRKEYGVGLPTGTR